MPNPAVTHNAHTHTIYDWFFFFQTLTHSLTHTHTHIKKSDFKKKNLKYLKKVPMRLIVPSRRSVVERDIPRWKWWQRFLGIWDMIMVILYNYILCMYISMYIYIYICIYYMYLISSKDFYWNSCKKKTANRVLVLVICLNSPENTKLTFLKKKN